VVADSFKTHWFHILVALAEEDLHGHGLIERVTELSEGAVKLWPVTMTAALDDMTRLGWIKELTGSDHPKEQSARRRYFRILKKGRLALKDEASRMRSLATLALRTVDQ
jgi:DNA-binding PadR family transcriptional regulator